MSSPTRIFTEDELKGYGLPTDPRVSKTDFYEALMLKPNDTLKNILRAISQRSSRHVSLTGNKKDMVERIVDQFYGQGMAPSRVLAAPLSSSSALEFIQSYPPTYAGGMPPSAYGYPAAAPPSGSNAQFASFNPTMFHSQMFHMPPSQPAVGGAGGPMRGAPVSPALSHPRFNPVSVSAPNPSRPSAPPQSSSSSYASASSSSAYPSPAPLTASAEQTISMNLNSRNRTNEERDLLVKMASSLRLQDPFFSPRRIVDALIVRRRSDTQEMVSCNFNLEQSDLESIQKQRYRLHLQVFESSSSQFKPVFLPGEFRLFANSLPVEFPKAPKKQQNKKITKTPLKAVCGIDITSPCSSSRSCRIELSFPKMIPFDYSLSIVLVEPRNIPFLLSSVLDRRKDTAESSAASMEDHHDDDVELTEETVNIRDPISLTRIRQPAKGKHCKHKQCFDLETFLQLAKSSRSWNCSLCDRQLPFEELVIDSLFERILQQFKDSDDVQTVRVNPDNTFEPMIEGKKLLLKEAAMQQPRSLASLPSASAAAAALAVSTSIVAASSASPAASSINPSELLASSSLTISASTNKKGTKVILFLDSDDEDDGVQEQLPPRPISSIPLLSSHSVPSIIDLCDLSSDGPSAIPSPSSLPPTPSHTNSLFDLCRVVEEKFAENSAPPRRAPPAPIPAPMARPQQPQRPSVVLNKGPARGPGCSLDDPLEID